MGKKVIRADETNIDVKEILGFDPNLYEDIVVTDMNVESEGYQITETKSLQAACETAFRYLAMDRKDSMVISGIGCCGKTTLAKYIAKRITIGKCPEKIIGSKILQVSKSDAGEDFEQILDFFTRVCELCEGLGYDKVIFFLDDVQCFSEAISQRFGELLENLKEAFSFELLKFIVTEDLVSANESNMSINKISNSIELEFEILHENIINTLRPRIVEFQRAHKVTITDTMAQKVVSYVYDFAVTSEILTDYDTILDYIELAIIIAEKDNSKSVTIDHVKKIFEAWDRTLFRPSKSVLKSTAEHEAGHLLVALCNQDKYWIQAVNGAIKTSGVGGLCDCVTIGSFMYKQDVIVEIAYSLGGRVMSGVSDAGDSGDLSGANKTAREWVMTVGCGKKVGKSVYLNYDGNEKFMSNEMKLAIEDEIRELLLEGEEYCKKIYKKHKKFHKLLSREIEKKFILTRSEILKLWKDYLKQSKKKKKNKKKKK